MVPREVLGVESPPCNAGDAGSIPDQGTRILYAVEQLSLSATTKIWSSQINEFFAFFFFFKEIYSASTHNEFDCHKFVLI